MGLHLLESQLAQWGQILNPQRRCQRMSTRSAVLVILWPHPPKAHNTNPRKYRRSVFFRSDEGQDRKDTTVRETCYKMGTAPLSRPHYNHLGISPIIASNISSAQSRSPTILHNVSLYSVPLRLSHHRDYHQCSSLSAPPRVLGPLPLHD